MVVMELWWRFYAASLSGNRLAPLGGDHDLEFVWYKATPSDFNTGFVSDKEVPAQPLPQAPERSQDLRDAWGHCRPTRRGEANVSVVLLGRLNFKPLKRTTDTAPGPATKER